MAKNIKRTNIFNENVNFYFVHWIEMWCALICHPKTFERIENYISQDNSCYGYISIEWILNIWKQWNRASLLLNFRKANHNNNNRFLFIAHTDKSTKEKDLSAGYYFGWYSIKSMGCFDYICVASISYFIHNMDKFEMKFNSTANSYKCNFLKQHYKFTMFSESDRKHSSNTDILLFRNGILI